MLSLGRTGQFGSVCALDAPAHVGYEMRGVEFGDMIPDCDFQFRDTFSRVIGHLSRNVVYDGGAKKRLICQIEREDCTINSTRDGLSVAHGTEELGRECGGHYHRKTVSWSKMKYCLLMSILDCDSQL